MNNIPKEVLEKAAYAYQQKAVLRAGAVEYILTALGLVPRPIEEAPKDAWILARGTHEGSEYSIIVRWVASGWEDLEGQQFQTEHFTHFLPLSAIMQLFGGK